MTRPRTYGGPLVPALAALALGAFLAGCSGKGSPVAATPTRTFRMGFSAIPPRPDFPTLLAALQMWTPRADAALISYEVPWDSLLADLPPDSIVLRNLKPLADYYRARGLALYVNVDPTNGLDRASDAPPLVAAGRSLTEPAIQQLLRAYVTAVDTVLHPPYLGLASETNLVRAVAPASLYGAVVQVATVSQDPPWTTPCCTVGGSRSRRLRWRPASASTSTRSAAGSAAVGLRIRGLRAGSIWRCGPWKGGPPTGPSLRSTTST